MDSGSVDYCSIPTATSPDGNYNFENPESLAPATISVGVILALISTTLTIGRTYVNRRKLYSAEYLTIVACIFNVAFTGDILAQYKYNRHQWDIPVCWFTASYLKLLYVQTTLFAPVFSISKAAIFLLLRQIFAVHSRLRVAVRIGLLITFFLYLPNIPLSAIYDAPRLGHPWDLSIYSSSQNPMVIWGIVQSSLSTLLDFYIFILPLPIIIKLNMPLGRRLQLTGIFTTALMGVIASLLSLVYRIELLNTVDTTWSQTKVAICALVESNVAIIVSCLPSFSQLLHVGGSALFRSLRSRLLGVIGSGGNSGGSKALDEEPREERPKMATFGSAQPPGRRNYYELTDTMLLKSQDTNMDGEADAPVPSSDGVRPMGIYQQFGPDSTVHLA